MRKINPTKIQMTKAHNNVDRKAIVKVGDLKSNIQTINEAFLNPQEEFEPHVHVDCEEIYYIQKGVGILKINLISYVVNEGDWIIIEQNEIHTLKNSSNALLRYISIRVLVK